MSNCDQVAGLNDRVPSQPFAQPLEKAWSNSVKDADEPCSRSKTAPFGEAYDIWASGWARSPAGLTLKSWPTLLIYIGTHRILIIVYSETLHYGNFNLVDIYLFRLVLPCVAPLGTS